MSIYIKGFDIPQDGIVRVIMIESDGSVRFYGGSSVIARAVEVPPHGALSDLDDLSTKVEDAREAARQKWRDSFIRIPLTGDAYEEGRMDGLAEAVDLLGTTETIIPADPEEEDGADA